MIDLSKLEESLSLYQKKFSEKVQVEEHENSDILMDLFGITPEKKRENKQYWGRELGACWERVVQSVLYSHPDFRIPRYNEFGTGCRPVDLFVGNVAIDTKYRIGSR